MKKIKKNKKKKKRKNRKKTDLQLGLEQENEVYLKFIKGFEKKIINELRCVAT